MPRHAPPNDVETVSFPGVRAPDRRRRVDARGIGIQVYEWGDPEAAPLLLAHGGADFARTFDVFAPLLVDGGYRVVSWDHRGHGDSERAELYSWTADVRDALAVRESLSEESVRTVGHSKGGGLLAALCAALPQRFSHFVNIDGIPSAFPSSSRGMSLEERVAARDRWLASHLDVRRSFGRERRPGTLEELAGRRARQNPRLSPEWLRYLASVGAARSDDGWRWKLDPLIRMGTPGPWRPEWGLRGLRDIEVPMLVILGGIAEPMGWGTDHDEVQDVLPPGTRIEVFEDSGHFVHVEHPERTARLVLDFLEDAR